MATQGGYTWSYVDEDGNGQNVVADSAFILEWTELSDLNIENDEGKTDLELVFSEEPDSVTAERWPAEDRGRTLAMVTRREKAFLWSMRRAGAFREPRPATSTKWTRYSKMEPCHTDLK